MNNKVLGAIYSLHRGSSLIHPLHLRDWRRNNPNDIDILLRGRAKKVLWLRTERPIIVNNMRLGLDSVIRRMKGLRLDIFDVM